RSKLLLALLEISEGVALDRDGEMLGFALVRRFGHGRVIGPVVAPDAERAKGLIAHWINTYSDSFIRIDVFESSGLPAWFDKL
ncbi:histone acetyltransferase, partial [Klebsiella pneumoniae]|nr:histone acetyltransferase [Klebsiella pneumoniae]